MKKPLVKKILSETEVGYDLISEKFSQTRNRFWGELESIKDYVKDGDNVLDYGCGNGRLLELFLDKEIEYIGADISGNLIEFARRKYENREFVKLDPSQEILPFSDEYFNSVYSIAVFHHIPSGEFRLKLARELFRSVKSGGRIVVTAWNLWQPRYKKEIYKNWFRKMIGKSDLDWNDCYISFTDNEGKKFNRFHHAFTVGDLRNLFSKAGFKIEKCEVVDGRNVVLIGKK
ncbi:methyltransferase domain-containing protein [Patescibacteria group bacterium]